MPSTRSRRVATRAPLRMSSAPSATVSCGESASTQTSSRPRSKLWHPRLTVPPHPTELRGEVVAGGESQCQDLRDRHRLTVATAGADDQWRIRGVYDDAGDLREQARWCRHDVEVAVDADGERAVALEVPAFQRRLVGRTAVVRASPQSRGRKVTRAGILHEG